MPGVLVDTSIWIDHIQTADSRLTALMRAKQVVVHPLVIGELACGNLRARKQIVADLALLRQPMLASHGEALYLLETQKLFGKGLSWVDVHLLATAKMGGLVLWSRDKRLVEAAEDLGCAWAG